jgi:hypothetical protein
MTDIHTCSYYCDRPECIKPQRDEMRDKLLVRMPVLEAARSLIAAGPRPDGTYNRSREACEQLAKEVLKP